MPADESTRNEAVLCRLDEIDDGAAKGFRVKAHGLEHRIFAVRRGSRVYVYRNDCPHVGTPLDWAPDEFLDSRREHIICATHGAIFRAEDGECIGGPCLGDSLSRVAIEVREGRVYLLEDFR